MTDSMSNKELLQPGQGALALGASHRENSDLRYKNSDLIGGGQMYKRGLAEQAKVGGPGNLLAGLGPEMGGGGGPVDEYFVKVATVSQEQINKFLEWAEQQKVAGVSRVSIGGATVSLDEYRLRMEQILKNRQVSVAVSPDVRQGNSWERQIKDGRTSLEELIALRQKTQSGQTALSEELAIDLDLTIRQRMEQKLGRHSASPLAYAHSRMNELVAGNLTDPINQKEFSEIDLYLKIAESEPPEIRRWKMQLEKEISQLPPNLAKAYLERKVEAFRDADMLAELPMSADGSSTLMPHGIDFNAAMKVLVEVSKRHDVSIRGVKSMAELLEEVKRNGEKLSPEQLREKFENESKQIAVANRADVLLQPDIMSLGDMGRNLAAYVFEPQLDQVMRFAANLSQEQRNQWVARLAGCTIRAGRAGGRTSIYLSALGGDEGASSIESAIAKGQELVNRLMGAIGYIKPDQLHAGASFFKPEEIAALNEAPIKSTISLTLPDWIRDWAQSPDHSKEFMPKWIRNYKFGSQGLIQRPIEICPKDVLAVFYKTEAMKELLQSQAAGDTGYWEARGKWFEYALWLRAGIPESLAREIISRPKNERPEIKMTNQLTMTTRRNVDSKGIWLGENWWMVMEAEAVLMMSRSDYGMMPIDEFARRWLLGLRGTEQADYTRLYDLSDPFLQTLGGITYLPEYFSLVAKNTIVDPLQEEARKVVGQGEEKLNLRDEEEKRIFELRCKSLKELILINQPSPAKAKELSKMTMGLGEYRSEGNGVDGKINNWRRKVVDGMKVIDKTGIERLRLPELWKFVSAEHLGMTQEQLEAAWEGFDFSGWLEKEGFSKEEIRSAPTIGIRGWERFKAGASLRLMKMTGEEKGDSPYRDYDKNYRYLIKATENLDALGPLFTLTWESSTLKPIHIGAVYPANDREVQQEVPSQFNTFKKALVETAQKIKLGNFITKEAGQSMNLAAIQGFRDTHCAWDRDRATVEMVELKKAGRGTTFSIQRLTEKRLAEQWAENLGVSPGEAEQVLKEEILPFLNGYQFYFVETMEMKHAVEREKEMLVKDRKTSPILLGPHTGAVPEVTTPKRLYEELQKVTKKRISDKEDEIGRTLAERDPEYQGWKRFLTELNGYAKEEGFCWARLRDAAWSLPPDVLVDLAGALDKASTLSGGIMEALVVDTNDLINRKELLEHAILDQRWRFKVEKSSMLARTTEGIYASQVNYKVWKTK